MSNHRKNDAGDTKKKLAAAFRLATIGLTFAGGAVAGGAAGLGTSPQASADSGGGATYPSGQRSIAELLIPNFGGSDNNQGPTLGASLLGSGESGGLRLGLPST